MTSAIPVRCSTNWAMKPNIGSKVNLLSSFLPVQWNHVKYIWNNSYFVLRYEMKVKCDHRSKFSNLSNWKEEAWKKSGLQRDSKPMTSAIPVRCSTNWAMKPNIGSKANLLSSFLPVQWNHVKYIWNNSYFVLRYEMKVKCDHRSKFSNLSNWKEEAWKKSGLQRDSNPWPPRYRSDALPTELWSQTLGARPIYWVHFFPCSEIMWNIYEIIHILYCGMRWKWSVIITVNFPI